MEKISSDDYVFRSYEPEVDKGFIFNSYLKSFRSQVAKPHYMYYKEHQKIMEEMVAKSHIVLAVHPDHKEDIFGWAMVELSDKIPTINYVYVKQIYRNYGLMTEMLSALNINWKEDAMRVSHETPTSRALKKKYNLSVENINE